MVMVDQTKIINKMKKAPSIEEAVLAFGASCVELGVAEQKQFCTRDETFAMATELLITILDIIGALEKPLRTP